MESKQKENGSFFKVMYRTRLKIKRNDMPILNLSLLFSIIALLTAPWLVIIGLLVALIMGYRISIDRSGEGFEDSFQEVVEASKRNVQRVFNDEEE
ncbi:MAG TPA: DUF4342 domain-containing protein [Candidatus Limiplasma sp.]|nr:DUF4342 domain-containing protein [Candidatus Limiplasma sp.]